MKKIYDVMELRQVLLNNHEVILYGAGVAGRKLVQYVMRERLEKNICCVAVKSKVANPRKISSLHVIELECLQHYREKACFVVATTEEKHSEIYDELKEFGCQNIVFISDLLMSNLESIIAGYTISITSVSQQINSMMLKLENISIQIEEQNEICAVNTATFQQYRNCNIGKEIVIVATGPTLNYYVPIQDAIHIGVNDAWRRESLNLDYYFVQDGTREDIDRRGEGIKRVSCKTFVGKYSKITPWNYIEFPQEYLLGRENISSYFLSPGVSERIYQDICFHPVMESRSIVFSALHFAIFTYPKRIYLVGCDVTNDGYFSADGMPDLNIKDIKLGYARFKDFAKQYYPETEIISINPRGLKGLFNDIYTDGYLKHNQ